MRIYVAGPITKGDQFQNVARGIEVGELLFRHGHIPFIPHLTAFWQMMFPHPWSQWMEYDRHWIDQCEAMVVLPGYSEGAALEMRYAQSKGIPVFMSLDELMAKVSGVPI